MGDSGSPRTTAITGGHGHPGVTGILLFITHCNKVGWGKTVSEGTAVSAQVCAHSMDWVEKQSDWDDEAGSA